MRGVGVAVLWVSPVGGWGGQGPPLPSGSHTAIEFLHKVYNAPADFTIWVQNQCARLGCRAHTQHILN